MPIHAIATYKDIGLDSLYPVGHLSLLSPEDALESCEVSKTPEQSVNKRLLNMSATPADDVQTSPAWNRGANIQHFFDMNK